MHDGHKACDAFADPALSEECHDGIFMQNLVMGQGLPGRVTEDGGEAAGGHDHGGGAAGAFYEGAGFRADELSFPCTEVAEAYQDSCWSYQPVAIRQFLNDPGPRAMIACDLAVESARERCYAGYGKQSFGRLGNDPIIMVEICSLAMPPFDEACLGGVVELLIDREWGPENAIGFCGLLAAAGRDPAGCWSTLGDRIALLHSAPSETRAVCQRAPEPRLAAACTEAAGG